MQEPPKMLTTPDALPQRLLRLPTVITLTGLCKSTIYQLIAEHKFPVPVRISGRAVAWRQSDVEAWSDKCPPTH